MYKGVLLLLFFMGFAAFAAELTFDIQDFQCDLSSGQITSVNISPQSYTYYHDLKLPLFTTMYTDDSSYPQQLHITSISKTFIGDMPTDLVADDVVTEAKELYDNVPLKLGGSGKMRHQGVYSLRAVPFVVEDNKLYFVEQVSYELSLFQQLNEPKFGIADNIDLAIITTEASKDLFVQYRAFKLKQGISAEIKTVELIEAEYDGRNSADRIRNYIKDLYQKKQVKYVLLGGGYRQIPAVKILGRTAEEPVASDLFYSNLDGDFDSNGNGVYGEISDHPDYFPDLSIGRFPGNSRQEIAAIINKTMAYYTMGLPRGADYYNSLLLVGFKLSPTTSSEAYCQNVFNQMPDHYRTDRLYEENPGSAKFNLTVILNHLNKGYNFMYHNSHGSFTKIGQQGGWGIFMDHIFSTTAVSGLYFISSCHPGDFSYPGYAHKAMISPAGGCVNYVGSSGNEWPSVSSSMTASFFENCIGKKSLGEALAASKVVNFSSLNSSNSISRYLYFSYNLMGDPSNTMIVERPQPISFGAVSSIKKGSNVLNGTLMGTLPEQAVLSLIADGSIVASVTEPHRNFSIPYENLNADTVVLALSSPTSNLLFRSYVTKENDDVLIDITQFQLDDENHNGVLESGENFSISFDVETKVNNMDVDSLSIIVKPVLWSGGKVVNDTVTIPLPVLGSKQHYSPFSLQYVYESLLNDTVLTLDLSFRCVSPLAGNNILLLEQRLDLPVACPDLVLGWVNYSEEKDLIKVAMINKSEGIIERAEISLYSNGKDGETIVLHNIPGHEVIRDSLEFSVDSSHTYRLGISINGDHLYFSKPITYHTNVNGIKPVLRIEPDRDLIGLNWSMGKAEDYCYNVYLSYDDSLSSSMPLNRIPIKQNHFEFRDDYSGDKYVRISVVDKYYQEFAFSSYLKIAPIALYLDAPYQLSPYQLYNPVFLDGKVISSCQNSAVVGMSFEGDCLGQEGIIFSPVASGFTSSTEHQNVAIGDVDHNGSQDMVTMSYTYGDSVSFHLIDLTKGERIASKKLYGTVMGTGPVLVNYDEDPELEIMVSMFNDNISGDQPKGAYVYMLDYHDSKLDILAGFPLYVNQSQYTAHSPALVDLNNDDKKEIVFDCGWKVEVFDGQTLEKTCKYDLNRHTGASLIFADLDYNDQLEIYALARPNAVGAARLWSLTYDGNSLSPNSFFGGQHIIETNPHVNDETLPGPMIADIDGDDESEVVVLSSKNIYIFRSDGSNYAGFPHELVQGTEGNNFTTPSLADFDGDQYLDVLFMDSAFKIWCYSGQDGHVLPGFPLIVSDIDRYNYGCLPVGDLDDDGDLEFAVGTTSGQMVVYDYPLQSSGREISCHYRGDLHNSGLFTLQSPKGIKLKCLDGQISITWNKVAGARYYKILSSDNAAGPFRQDNSGLFRGTSWSSTSSYGHRKYYRVVAGR